MPTYEYECQACHERLEAVQGFHDPALSVCPACGGELRKVFSAVGIVFKGSGFYKNDSRTGSSTTKKASDAKGDAKSDATSTTTAAPSSTPSSPAPSTSTTTAKTGD